MNGPRLRCLLLSDCNIESLGRTLDNDPGLPQVESRVAPFGEVLSVALNPNHEAWSEHSDFVVVWTRPEGVVPSFARALEYGRPALADVLAEVDEFADAIAALRKRVSFVFVPSWTVPAYRHDMGLLDFKAGGVSGTLLEMNARLAARLRELDGVYMLDASRWVARVGIDASNPRYWSIGKIPFAPAMFKQATEDLKASLQALSGNSRKLIVLDLDDTLWGGIVGDDGWEQLRLGGHDAVGEAFVEFQRNLKALHRRGVLLGIVSKNEESVALEAIDKHPEMLLRREDFAGMRINWQDKAQNLAELVEELNLGLQSVVFIDDNPLERGRVAEMLPEVLVPDWPKTKTDYSRALLSLSCFDTATISEEDLKRTEMYVAERSRKKLQENLGSAEDWLCSLELLADVEPLFDDNIKRICQLLNKTNQMNLQSRRLPEAEFRQWALSDQRSVWGIRVADRFGDSGLTGILSVEMGPSEAEIVDFVLSCRVFGRKLEDLMVHLAVEHARKSGASRVWARYRATPKNKPCLDFWQRSGFAEEKAADPDQRCFVWDATRPYPAPKFIQVRV